MYVYRWIDIPTDDIVDMCRSIDRKIGQGAIDEEIPT